MDKQRIQDFFQGLINNPEKFSDLNDILLQTQGIFQEIMTEFSTADAEKKEALVKDLKEIGAFIEAQLEGICKRLGISKEQLQQHVLNANNYKPQDWMSLSNFQRELTKTQKEAFKSQDGQGKPKVRKHSSRANWVSA